MTISSKPRQAVVKVIRGFAARPEDKPPAIVHARGGAYTEQIHLSPEQENELGSDLFGYFEAERVGNKWTIKSRLPDSPNRTW